MKTSLKKLQKFAALRHDKRAQKHHQSLALDELARATQDMNDMRDCYDRLLSAAAATANSVYEFSESLREMGDCLLEKTALNDDEESGKVLLMLGKVQFDLQKLVDGYRSHIFRTITIPSESLLNELRIVEEMKKRCDGKREIYEDLVKKQKEKGKLRNSKGEFFPLPQLEEAHDEYDEEANVFVFRMKSLKQGQSRSFLTQASRHHAAQLYFFKKAVRSLEAIEPHVRLLAEQQHIDYQFSGLKDDGQDIYDYDDESDYTEDSSDTHDDGELSFDYGQNGPVQEVSPLKNSMELDNTDMTFSPERKAVKEILPNPARSSFSFQRGARAISKSAPLFPDMKLDSSDRLTMLRPSPSRKFASYVLPTPDETRSPVSGKLFNEAPQTRQTDINPYHSSPLDQNKYEKLGPKDKLSGPIILDTQLVLKESNSSPKPSPLPPPLSETLSFKQLDPNIASYAKKAKRQAFSGPLTGKPWPNNPNVSASGPIVSSPFPMLYSGSLLRTPLPRPTSTPKLSSRVSPTFVSAPKISELHELPRPPAHIVTRRPSNRGAYSGPLISRTHEMSTASISTSAAASALPVPPMALSRSYSIPAGGPMDVVLRVPLEGSQNVKMAGDIPSPPLTPISLPNIQPASPPTR
ncbi:uncharacterized protein at2g33490 [Phtheirospermum japonicum]|uniref:Uncharacterized protein at2g33490 n=1 Tax=Phtheirospermum japonicum TaxID=374723 RepID=A0A830CUZ5_9LAMI|nr:uncharacterized protein at2g33490 [Phtheirospermum japonicum]